MCYGEITLAPGQFFWNRSSLFTAVVLFPLPPHATYFCWCDFPSQQCVYCLYCKINKFPIKETWKSCFVTWSRTISCFLSCSRNALIYNGNYHYIDLYIWLGFYATLKNSSFIRPGSKHMGRWHSWRDSNMSWTGSWDLNSQRPRSSEVGGWSQCDGRLTIWATEASVSTRIFVCLSEANMSNQLGLSGRNLRVMSVGDLLPEANLNSQQGLFGRNLRVIFDGGFLSEAHVWAVSDTCLVIRHTERPRCQVNLITWCNISMNTPLLFILLSKG